MASDHFRALARRPVSLSATLAAADGGWQGEASVVDLGLGGAGLLARVVAPEGTSVRLELVSPSLWDPLLLDGVLAWSSSPDPWGASRLGVSFLHHRSGRLRALVDLITSAAYD